MSLLLVQHSGPAQAGTGTTGGGVPLGAGKTVIYQAFVGVLFFAPPAVQTVDRWKASYPDRVVTAEQRTWQAQSSAWPGPPPPPPPESAKPVYPVQISQVPALPTSQQRAWWGIERLAPIPSSASFRPVYSDWIARPSYQTQHQRAYFGPDRQPLPTPGWGAVFPAWLPAAPSLPTAQQRAFAYTSALAQLPVPPLAWASTYPDPTRFAPALPTAHQQAVAWPFVSAPTAPPLAWEALYPAWLAPIPGLPTHAQRAYAGPERPPVAPLGWGALYPVKIERPEFPSAAQQFLAWGVFTPAPTGVPALSWEARYPAWLAGPSALVTAQQRAYAGPERPPVAPLGWGAFYPAKIERTEFPAALQRAVAWGVFTPVPTGVPDLSWEGRYPAWLASPPALITARQRAYAGPDRPPVAPLGWGAVYPAWLPGRPLLLHQRAYFGPERQPLPTPGWGAQYPAWLPSPPILLYQRAHFGLDKTPLPTPGWGAVFPDGFRFAPSLPAALQRAFAGPDRQPLPRPGWGAVYPAWIYRPEFPAAHQRAVVWGVFTPTVAPWIFGDFLCFETEALLGPAFLLEDDTTPVFMQDGALTGAGFSDEHIVRC